MHEDFVEDQSEVFGDDSGIELSTDLENNATTDVATIETTDNATVLELLRCNDSPIPLPAVVTDNLQRSVRSSFCASPSKLSPPSRPFSSSPASSSPKRLSSRASASSSASPRSGSASLDDIEEQTTVLSPSESRALVAFLGSSNLATVRRALLITANAATFPANQYFLRRAGCIPVLNRFLDPTTQDGDVVEACEKALGNLALDEANLQYMTDSLTPLIDNAKGAFKHVGGENVGVQLEALICLVHLTRTTLHHKTLLPLVDDLLTFLDDGRIDQDVRSRSLQILINLSSNVAVAPVILSSRSLSGFSNWLALTPTGKPHLDAAQLNFALGVCNFLSNLLETAFESSDTSASSDEWINGIFDSEETLLGSLVTEVKAVIIRSLLFDLNRHSEPEVRFQGKRLYALLAPLWRKSKASADKTAIIEEET